MELSFESMLAHPLEDTKRSEIQEYVTLVA